MLETIHDLIRAEAALTVTCCNCSRVGKITTHLLRERFGSGRRLNTLRWRCTGCDSRNVRLGIGAASLADHPRLPSGSAF